MSSIPELGAALNVPIADVIRMGAIQIKNPESAIFKAFENQLMQKLAAVRSSTATETKKRGGKTRVYIQHAVPSEYRFSLVSAFPQFDIRWSAVDVRSGAVSIAVETLVSEYLLSKFNVKQGKVIAYGISIKQTLLRNRDWVHLCVPGHAVRAQAEFLRDDKTVAAVTHAIRSGGRGGGLSAKYLDGSYRGHCVSAAECTQQSLVGCALLPRTDTNLRQIAMTMRQHGMKLYFFAIPASKEMELGVEGRIPALDAIVFPSHGGEKINVCYKNAPALDMSYTYSNYLELIARTTVTLAGETYHKEFESSVHGYNVYKVTRIDKIFNETPPPYKSWIEPDYVSKYLAYLPVLREGGRVNNPHDWSLVGKPVDRDIINDVVDFAMRAQGVDKVSQRIEQKLFTRTSNYSLVNTVVHDESRIPVELFDPICLAVYCGVFMRKFSDGKAVTTLAPHARQIAKLSQCSNFGVAKAYAGMLLGNMVRSAGMVSDAVRASYYATVADADLPMPAFAVCPGFVEYSDVGSSNPRFRGWNVPEYSTNYGFTTMLPGVATSDIVNGLVPVSETGVSTALEVHELQALVATGEAYLTAPGKLDSTQHESVLELASGICKGVLSLFHSVPDINELVQVDEFQPTPIVHNNKAEGVAGKGSVFYSQVDQKTMRSVASEDVEQLTRRVVDDTGGYVAVMKHKHTENKMAFNPGMPEPVPGYFADDPKEYMRDALVKIFPNSLIMDTSQFESDRTYSGWDILAKAIRAKFDVSRLSGVKPESFYPPVLRGHVPPNSKSTFNTAMHAVNTRNLNTPKSDEPMDVQFLWDRAWRACLKVFYVDGADEHLANLPFVGPTEEAVTQWASKLDELKRKKLAKQPEGFTFPELLGGASSVALMVKGKTKPTLDASYATAVKHGQTIQYDPTGKSVAVFSPIVAQKVAREQEILKPNVLVLQGKSIDDVNTFLNNFDWRPNAKGTRKYIEIDYSKYDKSQGAKLAEMYLQRLAKFGVLPDFINFIKDAQHTRTVSAMKAGIKAWLRDQNMSGAAYTLDRNNDINELVIAELLLEIQDVIEFVILMGDDIIIAIRGDVDVSHWESDLARKYNLILKAAVHEHGYICSMDIVHLPGGNSRAVADVVKRSLSFMDQSTVDEEKFRERFESYYDGLRGIDDLHVQTYLSAVLPVRMKSYLPGTTSDAIMSLCKAHATLRKDYTKYRAMFAQEKVLRTY
jgi:hypothetical protein